MTLRSGALLAVFVIGAGACSSADVAQEEVAEEIIEDIIEDQNADVSDVTVDEDSISFTIEDEDGGEAEVQIGTGADIPEGFPAPVPSGGEVQQSVVSSGSQGAWNLIIVYPVDRFEELAETYEAWMNSEGYEVQKIEQSGQQRSVTLIGQGDQPPGASVAIIEGGDGDVIVNLIVPS